SQMSSLMDSLFSGAGMFPFAHSMRSRPSAPKNGEPASTTPAAENVSSETPSCIHTASAEEQGPSESQSSDDDKEVTVGEEEEDE
ncbi:hypothetical protein ADUPG1_006156, partial [Aduncisulcus paluster]